MSLRNVINRFQTGVYMITRTATGAYVNGRYTSGSPSTFTVVASIQPISGRDLQTLPEGQHATNTCTIYTRDELKTRTPDTDPDEITIDGEQWAILSSSRWQANSGSPHYECMASRKVIP